MGFTDMFGSGGDDTLNMSLNELRGVDLPTLQKYYPELYKKVVELNPELENTVNLGASAMEGVSTDPRLKTAQMAALQKLQEIGSEGGLNTSDKAQLNQVSNDVNANLKGNQDAVTQNMAMRGMSGGMSEMISKQIANQGAANRSAQVGTDIAAQAQKRALDAILQSGQLGGQMQGQDFSQQQAVANSKDAIAKFNAANSQDVQSRNVSNTNAAKEYNANNTQNTANSNTNLNNTANQYNLGLSQREFDNKMTRAGAVGNASQALASAQNAERNANMQLTGNLIGAAATGGASIYATAAKAAKKKNSGG